MEKRCLTCGGPVVRAEVKAGRRPNYCTSACRRQGVLAEKDPTMATIGAGVAGTRDAEGPGGRTAMRSDCVEARSQAHDDDRLDAILDVLRAMLERLGGIHAAIERQPAKKPLSRADRLRLGKLLPAIAGAIGSEMFFVHELFESDSPALRVALRGLNAKKAGRLLRRAVGTPIGGLVVEDAGPPVGGVIVWRVSGFLGIETLSVPCARTEDSSD